MKVRVKENASSLCSRGVSSDFRDSLRRIAGKVFSVSTDFIFANQMTINYVSEKNKKSQYNIVGTNISDIFVDVVGTDYRIGRQFCSYCNRNAPLTRSNGSKINTCPHCHQKGHLKPFPQNYK